MDAQDREWADETDPSAQWVLNPRTGEYEFRAAASSGEPAAPRTSDFGSVRSSTPDAANRVGPRAAVPGGVEQGDPDIPGRGPGSARAQRAGVPDRRRHGGSRRKKTSKRTSLGFFCTLAFVVVVGAAGAYLFLGRPGSDSAAQGAKGAPTGTPGDDTACVSPSEVEKKEGDKLKGARSAPSDVRVDIYNAGAAPGSAQTALTWLQTEQDVPKSSQLGEAGTELKLTTLEYSPDQADQARELAHIMGLPASAMKPGRSETNSQDLPAIVLRLGPDFRGPGKPIAAPTAAPQMCRR